MRATPLYWVIRSRLASITIINTKNRSGVARRKKPVIPSLEELEEKESDKHDESLCNPFSRTFSLDLHTLLDRWTQKAAETRSVTGLTPVQSQKVL
jgi:hypothetical protein